MKVIKKEYLSGNYFNFLTHIVFSTFEPIFLYAQKALKVCKYGVKFKTLSERNLITTNGQPFIKGIVSPLAELEHSK